MSRRYKGAVISATPPTTTGGDSGTAPGEWTLQQQMQAQGGGIWPNQPPPPYIEDVFSTWLYTGTGAAQTITNGIDLSTKGGLTWIKRRDGNTNHAVVDTARGRSSVLFTDSTVAEQTSSAGTDLTSFNANGFSIGTNNNANVNTNAATYVSWTFRKQPKFFDVVTYTGNGISNTRISHNLGSVPGCIIVKCTSDVAEWVVYHRSITQDGVGIAKYLRLDSTAAVQSQNNEFGSTAPTSTDFGVGTNDNINFSGRTYVAYLFAHNAGGFGLTGSDNVISCGSFTTDGSGNATVNLGYEPQWILIKQTSDAFGGVTGNWSIQDSMRGLGAPFLAAPWLYANASNAEVQNYFRASITATGFNGANYDANTPFIYIAIRRGPMKVPTDATKVYLPVAVTPSGSQSTVTTNFPTDLIITTERSHASTGQTFVSDRLRGTTTASRRYLNTAGTAAEVSGGSTGFGLDSNVAIFDNFYPGAGITNPVIYWAMRRAPSFFDEVCYTGLGAADVKSHNLGVVPELMIVKCRSDAYDWYVFATAANKTLILNTTAADQGPTSSLLQSYTSTTFKWVDTSLVVNGGTKTYVAYLFATCTGVSKVGSYTGTGTTKQIDCGFSGGARFVLIKRTDSTGDWYVWDTARGMVAGTDPSLLLNSTAAEVNANSIYTTTGGFQIVSTVSGINASGGSYIYLAIA